MIPPPPFQKIETACAGLFVLQPRVYTDARGTFVKTFHEDYFRAAGIHFVPREEFFSVSARNVLRGMHFQIPPAAHAKLVYCITGRILDVVLDLRSDSPTCGQAVSRELSAANREMFFIPPGFAHGFLSLEDETVTIYKTDFPYAPEQDVGIIWNSFGFPWPVAQPIVSERDSKFPAWSAFQTPF
jgi:dTDP-4-dehydrorhamnose 3,5-epimerase